MSGLANSLATTPIWFINTRMAIVKGESKKTIWETVKEVYHKEGISAFYKGVLPNMILVTNPIINFVIYEALKKLLIKNNCTLNAVQLFVISFIGKAIATLCTYPILTIRVQMQANKEEAKSNVVMQIFNIIKKDRLEGLYVGVLPKLIQTVLYNAFLMVAYEKLRRFIKFIVFYYAR